MTAAAQEVAASPLDVAARTWQVRARTPEMAESARDSGAAAPDAAGGAAAPGPQDASSGTPFSIRWGPDLPELIRYNRVEGLSVGVRAAALPRWSGTPVRVALSARLGWSGPTPGARLELEHVTLRRSLGFAAYSEVTETDPAADALGLVPSFLAVVAGRDEGDYYRRSGAEVWWAAPPGSAIRFRIAAHSARHAALSTGTHVALPRLWDSSWRYRPNMMADEGWEHGLEAGAAVLLGHDPRRLRGGVEMSALAAAGSAAFVRGSATARASLPLPADFRVDLEGSGGASTGDVTRQRLWALGGPTGVRGYPPRTRLGGCFWRGRAELAYALPLGDIVAFSDVGDVDPCGSTSAADDVGRRPGRGLLASVGGGLFLVDRVVRLSAAWALDGGSFRMDLVVADRR